MTEQVERSVEEVGRNRLVFRGEFKKGEHAGTTLEAKDSATLDILIADLTGGHISFETFMAALLRPTMVYRFASPGINNRYYGGDSGRDKARDGARTEIDQAVRSYARTLGMVPGPVAEPVPEVVDVETSDAI